MRSRIRRQIITPHRHHASPKVWCQFLLEKIMLKKLWFDEVGQDIAEYAVMLAVILVVVVGTIKLIGERANGAFSTVSSSFTISGQ